MYIILLLLLALPSPASPHRFNLAEEVQKYNSKYHLKDLSTKLTDNEGHGSMNLYGTRNFRVVLPGVMYRGGANNKYLTPRRGNMNPLPQVALDNLCQEEFSQVVYLYPDNFSIAPAKTACKQGLTRYKQLSPAKENKEILGLVFARIKGQLSGPVYTHCWNGWHASGLISGMALKQFCKWNGAEALQYWYKNVDGHSKGYRQLRQDLKEFKPYKEFAITDEERNLICPEKPGSINLAKTSSDTKEQ